MQIVPTVLRRIITLISLALFALAPFRAASAQQGQRLNLVRDAEIEDTIRTFLTPIWRVAGLDPEAVQIMIVQDNSLNAFVAGGQRIFINTGLLMRTETPNQLIGVLAHETGHIAGGHLARQQEELRKLSTMQILEMLLGGAAIAGGAMGGGGIGRSQTGTGSTPVAGSLYSYLQYSQAQEASADQAAITYLERTHQSPKGTEQFLRVLEQQERMMIGRRDPYLTDHPLTPDRIATFHEAAARSPYANVGDSPRFIELHQRMVAKLLGFTAPSIALQRYREGDRSVAARYGRAIALYRTGALGSALLTLDGLLKEYPNDPYFHELRGQMLFENGHVAEAVTSYRRAVQLLPGAGIVKVDFARALLETNSTANDQEAVRNLEIARQTEADSFELWRLMSVGYARLNNPGMTSLARAEMAVLRGDRPEAQAMAASAIRQLQAGTPAWQRAQDIKAYIDSRPRKN
ncbi:Putative Zn-dependent protease, contains TPR repeats [Enhydrobacter aerosaccus]|uniref:Putative Zn-dependent protease, contains TPR repeats n=1 Tax=Enhydrobacter aerosaccus TaxID=225324 RepID=A0A1T4LPJ5_9HYPH|nr:Putative Zn-dependent protease, contains TPR repeats [Enhydrobacter aerosaccus]